MFSTGHFDQQVSHVAGHCACLENGQWLTIFWGSGLLLTLECSTSPSILDLSLQSLVILQCAHVHVLIYEYVVDVVWVLYLCIAYM